MIRALMSNAAKRSKYLIASAVLAASSLVIAGVSIVAQPQFAQAATNCPYDPSFPETNVAFCGVWQQNGANATLAQDISSLQKIYADSKDSCTGAGVGKDGAKCTVHTDLRAVITAFYGNAGSIIPSMNATDGNTLLAVSCKDGTVRSGDCNGTVLGTGMRIAARWHESGSDFQHIINDVYTHSPSTFFNDDFSAVPTLVHKSATTGMVDFAVWLPCFNIITVTPSQPKKELNCTSLTATQTATDDKKHTITYHFVATATEKYNPITGYLFDFGDKSTKNVATSATTASTDHTYTQTNADQTITSTVKVNGTVGGPDCTKQFKIPAIPKQPASIACVSLTATSAEGSTNKYVFTATANPVNTTVTSYTFTFGDGSSETVATNTDTHTYGDGVSDTASVVINSPIGSTAVIPACQASIKTPTPPSQLTNTGAGDVLGIFAAATAAGAIFHRFVLRRKLAV